MRRTLYFVMALALVLGFTQCKKEQPTPQTEGVRITLTVDGGNSNSRVNVNPTGHTDPDYATVTFEEGDVIYVGNNGAYVGCLTYNGSNFSGNIDDSNLNEADYLHFYFMGNKGPADSEPTETVSITDQTAKYPVISYAHSTDLFDSDVHSYSAKLQNYCAIVKFTTNDIPTATAVTVKGMQNTVSVDFGKNNAAESKLDINPYTPGQSGDGDIILHAESNTERWAILLAQNEVENATVTATGYENGTCTVPEIVNNTYHPTGVNVELVSKTIDLSKVTEHITIQDGYTVTGTLSANVKISIADEATVTLNNATITGTNSNSYLWAGINCENNATIILEGTNNVTSFYEDYPGIHIASGKTLTIQGSGTLNASSNGGVNGWGAGIGGSDLVDCGNIVINSGTINATGGIYMAGIGGGYGKNCGSITINGGNVTATGGRGAAGIGTGLTPGNITGGDISITGGTVVATGGKGAAGIGSGFVTDYGIHNTCGNISITGGQVTATGGDGGNVYPDILNHHSWENHTYYGGAGIGTGSTSNIEEGSSSCGTITIGSGVTSVTATKGGGTRPATNSIGKNESTMNQGTCGTVTIGGTVYPDGATPNQTDGLTFVYPAPEPTEQIVDLSTITTAYTAVDGDILTGTLGTGVQISIADGATITLRSANINGSDNLSGTFHGLNCLGDATIILENNNNVVKANCGSEYGRAGIFVPQHKTLTFEAGNSSGFVAATGAGEAAGIGGYSNTHCGAIVINSGKVTGTAGTGVDETFGDSYSAGIGSSAYKRCDGITINGGQVIGTAYADGNAAGIGTGGNGICRKDGDSDGSQPAITISNTLSNYVKAQKGSSATYFIGGGPSSKCGIVTVGGTTYEDGGGNRGISSSTSLSYDFTVSGNSLIYMP